MLRFSYARDVECVWETPKFAYSIAGSESEQDTFRLLPGVSQRYQGEPMEDKK
jgi:hypothetical protein